SGSSSSNIFLGVQKVKDVNLNDLDRSIFLNRASCVCNRTAYLKALLQQSAQAKAATIPSTNVVGMFLGNQCDNSTFTSSCKMLKEVPFSEFRLSGLTAATSVRELAQRYRANQNLTATGGTPGSGGATGSGSATGAGG